VGFSVGVSPEKYRLENSLLPASLSQNSAVRMFLGVDFRLTRTRGE